MPEGARVAVGGVDESADRGAVQLKYAALLENHIFRKVTINQRLSFYVGMFACLHADMPTCGRVVMQACCLDLSIDLRANRCHAKHN